MSFSLKIKLNPLWWCTDVSAKLWEQVTGYPWESSVGDVSWRLVISCLKECSLGRKGHRNVTAIKRQWVDDRALIVKLRMKHVFKAEAPYHQVSVSKEWPKHRELIDEHNTQRRSLIFPSLIFSLKKKNPWEMLWQKQPLVQNCYGLSISHGHLCNTLTSNSLFSDNQVTGVYQSK